MHSKSISQSFTVSNFLLRNIASGIKKLSGSSTPRKNELERAFDWESSSLKSFYCTYGKIVFTFDDENSLQLTYLPELSSNNYPTSAKVELLSSTNTFENSNKRAESLVNAVKCWETSQKELPYIFAGEVHVALASTYGSQFQQDKWVMKTFNFKRNGLVLEIGAFHGEILSNSVRLERELDWKAICIEPIPRGGFEERSAIVINKAIGENGKHIEFVDAGEFSGACSHLSSYTEQFRTIRKKLVVETVSIKTILEQVNVDKSIDYLSLDTEGTELDILKTFPFSKYTVGLITVEHNYGPDRNAIRDLLIEKGFVLAESVHVDDWYVNPTYTDLLS
jgi:FkbM family methyltransferase